MTSPVLSRRELKRLPFQRRPVADPGTTLVFQMPSGEVVAPAYPYTTGDVWWRGPRAVFVVDTSRHAESFQGKLPSASKALQFETSVSYSWSVQDPAVVVRENTSEAAPECQGYLTNRMRVITRQFKPLETDLAERAIHAQLAQSPIELANGLRISGLRVELQLDPDQERIAKDLEIIELKQRLAEAEAHGKASIDDILQGSDLKLIRERADFYRRMFTQGSAAIAGGMLAQDPGKMSEAARFMVAVEQENRDLAIRAMKVIIDGDHVRIGELDPAVAVVVEQFTALVSDVGGRISAGPLSGGLTAGPIEGTPADDSAPAIEDNAASPAGADDDQPGPTSTNRGGTP